jgi:manganese/iron transport system permease protein/iron/zinc/copper transport system permease protein
MTWLTQTFIDPLGQVYFQKALIGGGVVGIVCGVVGCLVVLRRMAFLGDALAHAMIAGVAGGYLFMKLLFGIEAHAPAMVLGSVLAAIITVGLIGFVSRVSRIKEDAAIGIMYCGVFAAGVVLVSVFRNYIHIDLMHFIMGDVLGVADADLWMAVIVAAVVLTLVLLFFRQLQLVSFDPVMAASIGLPVVLLDYLLTTAVALVVVSGVTMVGVILVVALLITPASTAYMLSDRLSRMMVLAGFFGLTSVVGGLYLSIGLDSAGGGAIVVFSTIQFLVVLVAAPRYGMLAGWFRRRNMVPTELVEDVLKAIVHSAHHRASLADLRTLLPRGSHEIQRAVDSLLGEGLLAQQDGTLALTDKGLVEGRRVVRAHRLWETYLHHVGMPMDQLHERAEALEHWDDPRSIEYLDHRLGHPALDPHGSRIPQGETLFVSSLVPGQQATILGMAPQIGKDHPLETGSDIAMEHRSEDGERWTVSNAEGKHVTLDHDEADGVRVSLRPTGEANGSHEGGSGI